MPIPISLLEAYAKRRCKKLDERTDPDGLKKKAAPPADMQEVEAPVSKEYDAVRNVYQRFEDNDLDSVSWKDFQKYFQQFAQKYNKLFTEIRHNKPQVTKADLKAWLDNNQPKSEDYSVEYDRYNDPENMWRDVEQVVLKINTGAKADRILAQDPILKKYIDMVAQGGEQSGHPVSRNTVGWLRLDFIDEDWLLVDEVQSDLVNSVVQVEQIVEAEDFEAYVAQLNNAHVIEQVREKVSEERFDGIRNYFQQQGYTSEKLADIKAQLIQLFENWAEYGLSTLIEIARRNGIKNIAIHTADTIARRDNSVEANKVKIYYDNLAHSMGFREQQLNFEGMRGNFWVRTASTHWKSPLLMARWMSPLLRKA